MELLEALQTLLDNGANEAAVLGIAQQIAATDGLDDCDERKPLALFIVRGNWKGCIGTDIVESSYDDCTFEVDGEQWLICDESEREDRYEEALENYLDDGCVEGADGPYFDRDAWKRDARFDGAGCWLSHYDNAEEECEVDGEWFFLYRQN